MLVLLHLWYKKAFLLFIFKINQKSVKNIFNCYNSLPNILVSTTTTISSGYTNHELKKTFKLKKKLKNLKLFGFTVHGHDDSLCL